METLLVTKSSASVAVLSSRGVNYIAWFLRSTAYSVLFEFDDGVFVSRTYRLNKQRIQFLGIISSLIHSGTNSPFGTHDYIADQLFLHLHSSLFSDSQFNLLTHPATNFLID
jgi:hypothetical protein